MHSFHFGQPSEVREIDEERRAVCLCELESSGRRRGSMCLSLSLSGSGSVRTGIDLQQHECSGFATAPKYTPLLHATFLLFFFADAEMMPFFFLSYSLSGRTFVVDVGFIFSGNGLSNALFYATFFLKAQPFLPRRGPIFKISNVRTLECLQTVQ